ncbi:hypothetical protein QJS04_geneDACA009661 [Acorus gramineus]|uniref:DUF632 domain-containing protein n=1 Tax=Acorus gramineus TaxID=55184 RepID=A0AAV9B9K1_ACOGR|nr:hypothetical protein QJS04_geneDACA009661 [Acorus gramineus]
MGACASSARHLVGAEDEAVELLRERKRLLKSAVDRRYALAEAHNKYTLSLHAVADSLRLFVTRHSSPSLPLSLPPPSSPPSAVEDGDPPPPEPSKPSPTTTTASPEGQEREELLKGYVFTGMPPTPPSPMRDFAGWDFFNPFEGVRGAEEMVRGEEEEEEEEVMRVVREKEGIPELEEEGEGEEGTDGGDELVRVMDGCGEGDGEGEKGLTVVDEPERERELLEALKDVEDHFIRAYDCGKEVSRMLEANRFHLQSGFDEIKDNSSKIIHAITWHRSFSSQSSSSSYKSSLASSSKDSSWTEYKNELFEDYGGMESGSHSQTLGRLYAWEKKLYEEVKVGDDTRRIYERKCSQLRSHEVKGDDSQSVDKTRAAVKDLHTRIWVTIRTAETISKRIEKLRDEELQPQLIELLHGLMRTWKIMLESHESQNQIMLEVKTLTCSAYGKFCNDMHRIATLQLEVELQNWRTNFTSYIVAQRAYVEALAGWLDKFIMPEVEFYSGGRSSAPTYRIGAPPVLVICHDWLNSLKKLPDKAVSFSIRRFDRDVRILLVKQSEEQQQKRKVEGLARELDKRVHAFQRAENKVLDSKLSETKSEQDIRQQVEILAGRKELVEISRKKLDVERAKHNDCVQETQRVTLNGFRTGLASIFESLTDFSKASLKMYADVLESFEKAKLAEEKVEKPSCIEGSSCIESLLPEVDSG